MREPRNYLNRAEYEADTKRRPSGDEWLFLGSLIAWAICILIVVAMTLIRHM